MKSLATPTYRSSVAFKNRIYVSLVQAVMGTLVKQVVCQQQGLDPGRVYHTAIMPCYDKKLEASRSDFDVPGGPSQSGSLRQHSLLRTILTRVTMKLQQSAREVMQLTCCCC